MYHTLMNETRSKNRVGSRQDRLIDFSIVFGTNFGVKITSKKLSILKRNSIGKKSSKKVVQGSRFSVLDMVGSWIGTWFHNSHAIA